MKCLVVLFVTLGLAMSFVPRLRNAATEPRERDTVKGPLRVPQDRDLVKDPQIQDLVRVPSERYPPAPVLPVFRTGIPGDPHERDPVELENMMTGKSVLYYCDVAWSSIGKIT